MRGIRQHESIRRTPLALCGPRATSRSVPADVLTIEQRDAQRVEMSRPSVDVSADGRYVAFTSYSRLVPTDTNNTRDVYLLDRATGRVTLESVAFGGRVGKDSMSEALWGVQSTDVPTYFAVSALMASVALFAGCRMEFPRGGPAASIRRWR